MRIGIDLDDTFYQFPDFFQALMESKEIEVYVASGHTKETFLREDVPILQSLGVDTNHLNYSLLPDTKEEYERITGPIWKAHVADQLDFVFDDDADYFQMFTKTPIFKSPKGIRP